MKSKKVIYQAKINQVLKLKKKPVVNLFQINKKNQSIKTHPSNVRVAYPYFQITDTDQTVLELSKNYERIFIVYKKFNKLTNLNFFVNLPSTITAYCTQLYALQTLQRQAKLKLLSDKLLQRIYNLYLTTQYNLSLWKSLHQLTECFQKKSKINHKRKKTKKTTVKLLKKKQYFLLQIKKIIKMSLVPNKFKSQTQKKYKQVYLKGKRVIAEKERKRFVFKGQKLCYSVIFTWFKKIFNKVLQSKFFNYLSKNLKRLQKIQRPLPQQLARIWERFNMRITRLMLKRSFKKKLHKTLTPCLKHLTRLLHGPNKLLRVNLQYTALKKITKTKYNLLTVTPNKHHVVIPLKVNPTKLPTFNFVSLYNWPLGRISNYHFFKSQLPSAIQKKYYLPTFFTSIQQLNLTKMKADTKNLFEFFFFPQTQLVTEPMIESILYIILTGWNLQPVSSSKVTKSKELYTVLDHLYNIKKNENSPSTTKNILS